MRRRRASEQTESESTEDVPRRRVNSASDKPMERIQTSSAGQMQSTATTELCTLGSSLTRGNSAAVAGTGKASPRVKKKVAPKVILSRPKRATSSSSAVVADGITLESSANNLQEPEAAMPNNRTEKPLESLVENLQSTCTSQGGDSSSTQHEAQVHVDSEENRVSSLFSSGNTSSGQTTDEAISNTLNEVLCNTHSQEPEDIGLAGIVPSRLGLPGDDLHSDAIIMTAQHDNHSEIEVRTESADVSKTKISTGNSLDVASSVNSEILDSEQSFVYQTCTASDDMERTSQSPQSTNETGQTSQSSSVLLSTSVGQTTSSQSTTDTTSQTGQSSSPVATSKDKDTCSQTTSSHAMDKSGPSSDSILPQSADKNVQDSQSNSAQLTDKTGLSGLSSSPPSSQEPSQAPRSRRSGSAGQRSRRSQSRASSIGSEADGKESTSPEQSGSKGKKKVSH